MRRWMIGLVIGLVIAVLGCSVPDGGQMADLEDGVRELQAQDPDSYETLARWAASGQIVDFLRGKPSDQVVGDLQCRSQHASGGAWSDWQTVPKLALSAGDVVTCLTQMSWLDYVGCLDRLGNVLEKELKKIPGYVYECRVRVKPEFHPDRVAADAFGRNEFRIGDFYRVSTWIQVPEIAIGLAKAQVAPPLAGFAVGGALRGLLPVLCAMNAGSWGCPDSPNYPGGAPQPDKGYAP